MSDEQVNDAIDSIAKKNNMTTERLREALSMDGIRFADYRKQIQEQMTIQQLLQNVVGSNITITDQDIRNASHTNPAAFSDNSKYHLYDILIHLPEEPSSAEVQQAYDTAKSVMEQINKGDNFKTVAAANSTGEQALEGGDLGWRSLQELPAIFSDKVSSMKEGQVIGPIRADNGLHILKLEEVKNESANHYITQTHVRHILIKTNLPSDDQPARQLLMSIRQQLVEGADFATLAEKYSQDAGTAKKGGDVGWPGPGVLVPQFEQAMNGLPPHAISQPVKTSYGWHLIQVLERRQVNDSEQFKENQVKGMIYQREFEQATDVWLQQLRHDSYVKILS